MPLHVVNVYSSSVFAKKVIDYCTLPVGNPVAAEGRRALIRNMWSERIKGTKRNVEVCTVYLYPNSLGM